MRPEDQTVRSAQTAPLPEAIRALIVSDIRFLYESLSQALAAEPGIEVAGHVSTISEALEAITAQGPNFVLLDASFPAGPAAVRQILAASGSVRVVVLAVAETEENVLLWARAGACGFIPGTARLADLIRLLDGIKRGEQALSARITGSLLRHIAYEAPPEQAAGAPKLTSREKQVLRLIGAGLGNKEIARELDISLATTKSHVHNLLGKLNVAHRGRAAAWMRGGE